MNDDTKKADLCGSCGMAGGIHDALCRYLASELDPAEWACGRCGEMLNALNSRGHTHFHAPRLTEDDILARRIEAGKVTKGLLLVIMALVFALMATCTAGPRDPEKVSALDDALGMALPAGVRGAVMTPPWAFPGPLERVGRCTLTPGQVRPNGEVTRAGDNLGRFPTDPDVVRDGMTGGMWRMAINSPQWDPRIGRWPTQIAEHTSNDGLLWSVGRVLLPPRYVGPGQPEQYETPSLPDEVGEMLATMTYRYVRGNRPSRISFWSGREEVGTLEPVLPWEMPYRTRDGKMHGGVSEPSQIRAGQWRIVFYQADRYSAGVKPSVGVAGSLDGGETWVRMPEPIVTAPSALGGAGQPHAVKDPRGGIHLFWQEKRLRAGRLVHEVHHGWIGGLLSNVQRNPHNPILTTADSDGWDRGRITATGVTITMDGDRATFHAWYFGADGPDGSGAKPWIGYARYQEPLR